MESSEEKKGIFTHTLVYSIGNFLSRGLNFILLPIYSHYIAPSEFGIYSVIISVITIASTILNFGLPGIFVKSLSELESADQKKKFISNVISGISIVSVPVLFLIMFYSNQISLLLIGNDQYYFEIILGVISVYALNYSYYFSVFYIAEQNSKKYVLINSLAAIANFSLNIILIVIFKLGINGIFISQILSSLLLIILSSDVVKNFFKVELDLNYLKPVLITSFPILLSGICTIIVELIDRFIVLKYLGEEQAGIYSFGYRIALIYNLFILSFKTAWIPHYFSLKVTEEEEAKHLGRVLTKIFLISSILILTIQILVELLFNLELKSFQLFDKSYSEASDIIIFVMIGYFFSMIMSFYSIAPYKFNRTIHFLNADLITLALNLILNFSLIPTLGIKGAALATMFAFLGGALYLIFYSSKKIKVSYELKLILLVIVLSIATYLSIKIFNNYLFALIFLAVLVVIGYKFNLVRNNLREVIKFK